MKRDLFDLIKASTAYGLSNIIFVSVAAASYYIVNDLVDYYNYDVVTAIKIEYDQPKEFPTISFWSIQTHLYDTVVAFGKGQSAFSSDADVFENQNNHYESFS